MWLVNDKTRIATKERFVQVLLCIFVFLYISFDGETVI